MFVEVSLPVSMSRSDFLSIIPGPVTADAYYSQHVLYLAVGERTAPQAEQVVRCKIMQLGCPKQGSGGCDYSGGRWPPGLKNSS